MPKHILAFDFGTKRIGAAAVDLDAYAIAPVFHEIPTLPANEGIPNWDSLQELLQSWQPNTVVIGLPKQSDGSDMEITRRARKFGNRIKGKFSYPVDFIDETLSTKAAKQEALERGRKTKSYANDPVDSIAARLILESWINEQES